MSCLQSTHAHPQNPANAVKTIAEVAADWELHKDMQNPERWLKEQIRAGRIRARKIGRTWRMTDADIAHALDVFANTTPATPEPAVELPRIGQPTRASMRRRVTA